MSFGDFRYIRVWGREPGVVSTSGMDHYDRCNDSRHFEKYPWPVEYRYNDRGFRDHDWPNDQEQLKNSIWCLGDSFTVGLGAPFEHTWPQVLSQRTGRSVVNCSMDGASNEWLCDLAACILEAFNPPNMVMMWSFVHRREGIPSYQPSAKLIYDQVVYDCVPEWKKVYDELRQPFWPQCKTAQQFNALPQEIKSCVLERIDQTQFKNDLDRRVHYVASTDEDDLENLKQCMNRVTQYQNHRVIHSSVPSFAPAHMMSACRSVLESQPHWIPDFKNLDYARDGFHFDVITSQWIADQISSLLL